MKNFDHEKAFLTLKSFYRDEIRRLSLNYGYRELSETLGHQENFISVALRRDSFASQRRLYVQIINYERELEDKK